jgi:hypothetical protein
MKTKKRREEEIFAEWGKKTEREENDHFKSAFSPRFQVNAVTGEGISRAARLNLLGK